MPLDPEAMLALPPIVTRHKLNETQVILYAEGVGAHEQGFIYEEGLRVLPTMASILAFPGFFWPDLGLDIDWRRVVPSEASLRIHAPLPASGMLVGHTRFGPVFDKGDKGAFVYTTREIHIEGGAHLATMVTGVFLRGDGNFGGTAEGKPKAHAIPDRAPDHVVDLPTRGNAELLQRLSGDNNPLHVDPVLAGSLGFKRPILHGLATAGVAGRALTRVLAANDPERVRRIDVRFSSPAFPGETVVTDIWESPDRAENGNRTAAWRARVEERDAVVLDHGYVEFQ